MRTLERIARKICEAAHDDPDLMAYPPMMLPVANGIRYVTIAPQEDYCQPRPLWNWYLPMAEAAVRALECLNGKEQVVGKNWSMFIDDILNEKEG